MIQTGYPRLLCIFDQLEGDAVGQFARYPRYTRQYRGGPMRLAVESRSFDLDY
jgi:hypothetical protein